MFTFRVHVIYRIGDSIRIINEVIASDGPVVNILENINIAYHDVSEILSITINKE